MFGSPGARLGKRNTRLKFARALARGFRYGRVRLATVAEFAQRAAFNLAITPAVWLQKPAFRARSTGQTGIADATYTKAAMDQELYDVGGYYDTSLYRWTPPAGPVFLHATAYLSGAYSIGNAAFVAIAKNGGIIASGASFYCPNGSFQFSIAETIDAASGTDYYEAFVYGDTTSGTNAVNVGISQFSGRCL